MQYAYNRTLEEFKSGGKVAPAGSDDPYNRTLEEFKSEEDYSSTRGG